MLHLPPIHAGLHRASCIVHPLHSHAVTPTASSAFSQLLTQSKEPPKPTTRPKLGIVNGSAPKTPCNAVFANQQNLLFGMFPHLIASACFLSILCLSPSHRPTTNIHLYQTPNPIDNLAKILTSLHSSVIEYCLSGAGYIHQNSLLL